MINREDFMWLIMALFSAFFAGVTAILAKWIYVNTLDKKS